MKRRLLDLLNPWAATREARHHAERLAGVVLTQRNDIECLHRDVSIALHERNTARGEVNALRAAKSAAVARGNRTRALRRRGDLLLAPINEPNTGQLAN